MFTLRRSFLLGLTLAVATTTTAHAASFSIDAPKRVDQWKVATITWEGDTRPTDVDNRIARVIATKQRTCPATIPPVVAAKGTETIGGANIFHAGGFRGAKQTEFTTAGKLLLCGYLSATPGSDLQSVGTPRSITVRKHRIGNLARPKLKDATYTSSATDLLGGDATSSLTFTVAKGQVTAVAITGVPNTLCRAGWPGTPTPISPAATSTGPASSFGAPVIGDGFTVKLASPAGPIDLIGAVAGNGKVYGTAALTSTDGSCRGGFGFTAHRS